MSRSFIGGSLPEGAPPQSSALSPRTGAEANYVLDPVEDRRPRLSLPSVLAFR